MSKMPKTFMESLVNLNEDTCMEEIVKCFQKVDEVEQDRDANEQLSKAKEIVKDLSAGYSSAIKLEKKKIRLLIKKLKEIQNGEINPTPSV